MSSFDLTLPCDNCPFRREGGIRVHPRRAEEIANAFTDSQGASFPCHKTVDYDAEEEDEYSGRPMKKDEQMCAGGLVFAEKNGCANQLMRIMERVGAYDASKLRGHDDVFDTLDEMIAAQSKEPVRRPKPKKAPVITVGKRSIKAVE